MSNTTYAFLENYEKYQYFFSWEKHYLLELCSVHLWRLFWTFAFANEFNKNPIILSAKSSKYQTRPQGYKTFFMLNSAEHEIFSTSKYNDANYC